MEVNYVLSDRFWSNNRDHDIGIGINDSDIIRREHEIGRTLTEDEIIQYTVDAITHEHIHIAIYDITHNRVASSLFDVIQLHFRQYLNAYLAIAGSASWNNYSYRQIRDAYGITDLDYRLCVQQTRVRYSDYGNL